MSKPDLKRLSTWPSGKNARTRTERRSTWNTPLPADALAKRAWARRRWNLHRRRLADARRLKLLPFLHDPERNGAELARQLGVSRATVCADFAILQAQAKDQDFGPCNARTLIRALKALRLVREASKKAQGSP